MKNDDERIYSTLKNSGNFSEEKLKEILQTATDAAISAGNLLKSGFGSSFSIENKEGRHNLVTEYDKAAENLIISHIQEKFPDHVFLAEESGATGKVGKDIVRWIIDPLDGTVNFAHNIPIFCVSIAAELNGEVVCCVIYQPLLQELFTSVRGEGAFLNGNCLSVSKTSKLDDAVLVTGFPYDAFENPGGCIDHFAQFIRMGLPVRRLGSAALDLAYTAAGRFDGFWEIKLNAWDIAAGKLLVEEAGGSVTLYDGTEHFVHSGQILATNGLIHNEMIQVLKTR